MKDSNEHLINFIGCKIQVMCCSQQLHCGQIFPWEPAQGCLHTTGKLTTFECHFQLIGPDEMVAAYTPPSPHGVILLVNFSSSPFLWCCAVPTIRAFAKVVGYAHWWQLFFINDSKTF